MMVIYGPRPVGMVVDNCIVSAPGIVRPGLNENDNCASFSEAVETLKEDLLRDMIGAVRKGASLAEIRDVLMACQADSLGPSFKSIVIDETIATLEAQIEAGLITKVPVPGKAD